MIVDQEPTAFTLLTMSFNRDFELCRLLCRTIDDMVSHDIAHVLAVPASDIKLFSSLKNGRRTLVAQEDLIPAWLTKVTPPSNWLTRKLRLPKRNFYLSSRGLPVRGWIAQQLMKLNAAEHVGTETIIHADSDIAFVRPVDKSSILVEGRTPLLRFPGAADTPTHRPWHRSAAKALGLPPRDYFGADFISHCVPWRRSVVKAMLSHIGASTGQDPIVFLSRLQHLSEYILYGVYCEFVRGIEASGHYATDHQICRTLWTIGADTAAADQTFSDIGQEVAIGIQSTIPLTIEDRSAIVERLRRRMAA